MRVSLVGSEWQVDSADFDPSGRRIVTGSIDRSVRVWDLATGKVIGVFPLRRISISSTFLSDGRRLVATDAAGLIQVIDVSLNDESIPSLQRRIECQTPFRLVNDLPLLTPASRETCAN
jgi:WD40 repeat protein